MPNIVNHMDKLDYKIVYIDNVNGIAREEDFQVTENIDKYTSDLLIRAIEQQDRRYKFNENKRTTRDRVLSIAASKTVGNIAIELGNDLASSEKNKNDEIKQLKRQIPLGVLIVAYGECDGREFVLLLKSDYDKFISEATGKIQSGLSLKNQIFKTCQFSIKRENHVVEFSEITTSDSTKRQSEYWHKDFLELIPEFSDTENTSKAYTLIKNILKPLQKQAHSDYNTLKQNTVGYFRRSGMFNIDEFRDEIIGKFQPQEPDKVDINKLKSEIDKIKKKRLFDPVFNKDTSVVKDKIQGSHKLTEEMYLRIKSEIPNPETVILPYEQSGRKGVTIISERGYDFAKDVHDNKV